MALVVTFLHRRKKSELRLEHGELCATLVMAVGGCKMFGDNYTLPFSG